VSSIFGAGNPLLAIAGYAIGTAAGPALRPGIQDLANEAWQLHPVRPLGATEAAAAVVEGIWLRDRGAQEAEYSGFDGGRFDALRDLIDNPPPLLQLFELWRRDLISDGEFTSGLRKTRIEPEWFDALRALRNELLSSAELAMMQQQGFIDAARANSEAALQGVTAERQQLRFETSGLPPGVETGLAMLRRGIVTPAEFAQIVREGHTKTKYVDEFLALRRPLLSAAEYAGLHLRGWISEAEMNAGGAQHGFTPEDMHRLFLNRGRPISPTQAYTAFFRAAPGPYGGTFARADFDKVIAQSNVRPEYADTLWHNRFSYPSLFQLRGAVQSGGITPARARTIMHYQRYEEQDIGPIVGSWLKAKGAATRDLTQSQLATEFEGHRITEAVYRAELGRLGFDANEVEALVGLSEAATVAKQKDALVTALRSRYLAHKLDEGEVRAALDALGITTAGIEIIVPEWTIVRDAARPTLTASQVRAAYRKGTLSRTEALADLEALGYTAKDANTYLDS
jgi:methylmalonyl-CoA mutase cobalamin-binding subunit